MRKVCAFVVLPEGLRRIFECLPGVEFVPGHLGITFAKALHRGSIPQANRDVLACLQALVVVNAYCKPEPDIDRPLVSLEDCGTCRIAIGSDMMLRFAPVEPATKHALLVNLAVSNDDHIVAMASMLQALQPACVSVVAETDRGLPNGFETFVQADSAPLSIDEAILALHRTLAPC